MLMPLYIAVLPLTRKWQDVLGEWREKYNELLRKHHFAPFLKRAIDSVNEHMFRNGFGASGLYPFNKDAVHYERCVQRNAPEINILDVLEFNDDNEITLLNL